MARRSGNSIIVPALLASGVLTVVVGIVLALTVEPVLALIAGIGLIDFGLARAYATGRLGDPASGSPDDLAPGEVSQDPSFSPYARSRVPF